MRLEKCIGCAVKVCFGSYFARCVAFDQVFDAPNQRPVSGISGIKDGKFFTEGLPDIFIVVVKVHLKALAYGSGFAVKCFAFFDLTRLLHVPDFLKRELLDERFHTEVVLGPLNEPRARASEEVFVFQKFLVAVVAGRFGDFDARFGKRGIAGFEQFQVVLAEPFVEVDRAKALLPDTFTQAGFELHRAIRQIMRARFVGFQSDYRKRGGSAGVGLQDVAGEFRLWDGRSRRRHLRCESSSHIGGGGGSCRFR